MTSERCLFVYLSPLESEEATMVQFDQLARRNAELFRRFFHPISALLQIQPSSPCSDSNPSHVCFQNPGDKTFQANFLLAHGQDRSFIDSIIGGSFEARVVDPGGTLVRTMPYRSAIPRRQRQHVRLGLMAISCKGLAITR